MAQYTVRSLSEYVQTVYELNANLTCDGFRQNEILLFRGHSSTSYELIPWLGRGRRSPTDVSIFDEERNLIELAKYRLPDVFRSDLQPIELLALLQHHGIPTRLLDVTENALVALYFACCSKETLDGEVFAFKHNERNVANFPIINAIADSYRFADATICPLASFYKNVIAQPYFSEQGRTFFSDADADNWIVACCQLPLFVHAPIRSLRQQIQRGRYILFPNRIEKEPGAIAGFFTAIIDPIDKSSDFIAGRILVPKEEKAKMLSELTLMGINKAALFGDSIDIVCESIVDTCRQKVRNGSI